MKKRLYTRIFTSYLAVALASIALMGFTSTLIIRDRTTQTVENELRNYSRLFAAKEIGVAIGSLYTLASTTGCRITIVARNGTVLADSQQLLPLDNHLNRPEIIEARLKGTGSAIRYSTTIGEKEIYAATANIIAGKISHYVRVARPFVEVEKTIGNLVKAFLALSIIALIPCLLLSLVILRKIVAPVRKMQRYTTMIVQGENPGSLLLPEYNDFGGLIKNINAMFVYQREKLASLREERQKLSAILAGMTEGVMLLDCHLRVEELNENMLKMLSKTRQETIGKTPLELLRNSELKNAIDRHLVIFARQTIEIEIDESQQVFWEIDIASDAARAGIDKKIVIVVRDISRLKRLERSRLESFS